MSQPEIAALNQQLEETKLVLVRNGFVPCDISICNCGSWHARYGLKERFDEIKDILSEAGNPLCNENGNLVSNALKELIADRDQLKQQLADLKKMLNTSNT